MHWVLCCVVVFSITIMSVWAEPFKRTPYCWLQTYQKSSNHEWIESDQIFLDAQTIQSMEKYERRLDDGQYVFSIQFNSSNNGLYYDNEKDRDLDLHRLFHGNLSEEACPVVLDSSKKINLKELPFKHPILAIPDEEILSNERSEFRKKRQILYQDHLPGPTVPFYSILWGDFPEMFRKGTFPYMMDIWKKYGYEGVPVRIPFGPKTMYLISDPNDLEEIQSQLESSTIKGFTVNNFRNYLAKTAIGFLETSSSKPIRKAMFPHFSLKPVAGKGSVKGIEDYFKNMVLRSKSFVQHLKHEKNVDFEKEMAVFTMQTVAANMLGVELPQDKLDSIHSAFRVVLEFINYRMTHEPFVNPWTWIPTAYNRKYAAEIEKIRTLIHEMLAADEEHEKDGVGENSVIRMLRLAMNQKPNETDSEFRLTEDEVIDQVLNIFFAGHETTTHTLSMVTYALTQNPEVRERLQSEVLDRLGPEGFDIEQEPSELKKQLENMPYLLAVVKETLRLYPSVPGIVRVATESVHVNGYEIPKNSMLFLFFEGAHRLENYWWKPERFDPERFLSEKEVNHHPCGVRHKHSFTPFGQGERNCLGKFFAMQEVEIFVAELIRSEIPFMLAPEAVVKPVAQPTKRLEFGLPMIFGDHW